MAVTRTYDDAQHFAENDPFLRAGYIQDWQIRRWATSSAEPASAGCLAAGSNCETR
jgi:hypothetical protein